MTLSSGVELPERSGADCDMRRSGLSVACEGDGACGVLTTPGKTKRGKIGGRKRMGTTSRASSSSTSVLDELLAASMSIVSASASLPSPLPLTVLLMGVLMWKRAMQPQREELHHHHLINKFCGKVAT